MLTEQDVEQIQAHGLTLDKVYRQLEKLSLGIPFTEVVTPALVGNGIEQIEEPEAQALIDHYDERVDKLDVVKFVPASGAATRMFKFLYRFLNEFDPKTETLNRFLKRESNSALVEFLDNQKEFPFINQVRKTIRDRFPQYKQSNKGERAVYMIRAMLEPEGLNFGDMPKGLIPFHRYRKFVKTAFEEQLFEAAHYAASRGEAQLHFTFSPKHLDLFKETYSAVEKRVSNLTRTKFAITYSFQSGETDSIAVTDDLKPLRNAKGELIFRPSGHGALLKNLNEVNADMVFIKNIDNVCASEYISKVTHYKKLLAGKLLKVQQQCHAYLQQMEGNRMSSEKLAEVKSFLYNELHIKQLPETQDKIAELLDRPIRVCGMVRNTGAPGGGPFWVKDENEQVSLQIVESAQINLQDEHQAHVLSESSHFNPVDLVCGLKNYKGEKFDLRNYTDSNSGFIARKSEGGRAIRALELPGLWNGSMARWNTIFVEVPLITFNPVKTVNDLLRRPHKPNY